MCSIIGTKVEDVIRNAGWEIAGVDDGFVIIRSESTAPYFDTAEIEAEPGGTEAEFIGNLLSALFDYDPAEVAYDHITGGDMPSLDEMRWAVESAEELKAKIEDLVDDLSRYESGRS